LQPIASHILKFKAWNKIYIYTRNVDNWWRWGVKFRSWHFHPQHDENDDKNVEKHCFSVCLCCMCIWCLKTVTVFQSYHRIFLCLFKYIILCTILYFSVGKVTRGEEENIGVKKEIEQLAVMVNFFPKELRDTYLSTMLEQGSVQV
jgi:hypothetical protein